MPWHPPVLVIAVWDEWWEDLESGTYPINSGMSRVFYLPQHRTLSTRHPLALRRMRSTGCWVSADERRYWKLLGSPPGVWTPAFSAPGRRSTTRPLSCLIGLWHESQAPGKVLWSTFYSWDCWTSVSHFRVAAPGPVFLFVPRYKINNCNDNWMQIFLILLLHVCNN